MFRLVACDIDETLTDARLHLDPRAMVALHRVETSVLPVALVTENALPVEYTLRSYLGLSGPLIARTVE